MKKLISMFLTTLIVLSSLNSTLTIIAEESEVQTMAEETFESRKTPIMGWSSWNAFGSTITEEKLKEQIDLMVSLGLLDAGYEYFNTDDGYQNGRDQTTGRLLIDETKFPNGMKAIADYAHSKGLKAGIYTDAGDNNCSWSANNTREWGVGVGLYEHETDDLYRYLGEGNYRDTYAQNNPEDAGVECWGFDFIKVDWCGGQHAGLNGVTQYTKIGNIIKEIEGVYNKDKIYNICMWSYDGPWQLIADSWRIGSDIDMSGKSFDSMMVQVDKMKNLSPLTTPGHVNDPDMLVVGKGMTHEEDKTHFGLWCMFSAPLVMGNDLTTMSEQTLSLLTNEELIAINQDPACIAASYVGSIGSDIEVWLKPLGSADSDTKAIMLVNRSELTQTVTIDFEDYGYNGNVAMRDLFTKTDLEADTSYTVTLASHQSSILKLTPTENKPKVSMSTSTNANNNDIVFEGTDGTDYKILSADINSGDQITFQTEGSTETYTTAHTYNGIREGLSINGSVTLNIPKTEAEQTANLYLGDSPQAITVTSEIDGKTTNKTIPANSGTIVYSIKYFSNGKEGLKITVSGENLYIDAIEIVSDITSDASAQIGTTLSTTNLTEGGNLDWYWNGTYTRINNISKASGGNSISVEASSSEQTATAAYNKYTWSDGDIIEKSTSATQAKILYGYGDNENEYYEITLPSDNLERTVTVPFALSKADATVEFFVGGEKVFEEAITGSSSTTLDRVFTATYSSTVKSTAKVIITITNTYDYTGGIILDAVMLSADTIPFTHSSIGTNVNDYTSLDADIDYIDYTANSRKENTNILSDYFVGTVTTATITQNGVALDQYGDTLEMMLPSVSAFTRADIEIEIKNATAGVNIYAAGNNSYTSVWDIDGGKTAVISVWYESGAEAGIGLSVKGISANNSSVTLKSVALRSANVIADYPAVSQTDSTVTATLSAMSTENTNANLVVDLLDANGISVTSNTTSTELSTAMTEITSSVELPTEFTAGTVKVYVTDGNGNTISHISSFEYPINQTMSNAANDNRIGGVTANYYVNNKNAVLLDVRTAEEYSAGHLDGAINILYTALITEAKTQLPDKDAYIICYCSAGKRSAQAVLTLTAMGYTNVYNLGSMDDYVSEVSLTLDDPESNVFAENDTVSVYSTGLSRYDNIQLRYTFSKVADVENSILFDETTGITLTNDGDGVVDITAYLVLVESGDIIAQVTQSYTLLLDVVRQDEIDIFFTDLDSYSATGSWGTNYAKPNASVDGKTIKINGTEYSKGIGVNANNTSIDLNTVSTLSPYLTADIPKGATTFLAVVGKDQSDGKGLSYEATFHVYFDDVLYASSPALTQSDYYVFRINIPEGAQKAGLFCEGIRNSNHAAWGNVGFKLKDAYKIPDTTTLNVLEYFSDLDYTIVSGGTSYIHNDLSADGKSAITIAGNTFEKGVGVNAPTTLECAIPNGSEKFITTAGMTASAPAYGASSATFSIYIDSELIDSQTISKGEFYTFNIDIPETANTLTLETTTDNKTGNHNGWGFAAFTYASEQKTMLRIGYNNTGTSTAYDRICISSKRALSADTEYTLSFTNNSNFSKINSIFIGGMDTKSNTYGKIKEHHTSNSAHSSCTTMTNTNSGNRTEYTFVLTEEQATYSYQYVVFYFVCAAGTEFDLYLANLTLYKSDDPNKNNLLECDDYKTDLANWYSDYQSGNNVATKIARIDAFEYVSYDPSIFKTVTKITIDNSQYTSTSYLHLAQLLKTTLEKDTEYIISYKYYSPDISGSGSSVLLYGRDDQGRINGAASLKSSKGALVSNDANRIMTDAGSFGNTVKYSFTLSESQAIYGYYLLDFYFTPAAGQKFDLYISDLTLYKADDSAKSNLLTDDEYTTNLSHWRTTWGNCGTGTTYTKSDGKKSITHVSYGSGDSNGDGELDIRDLVHNNEQTNASAKPFNPLADTDCNNALNRLDFEAIRKKILRLFPF